MPGEGEGSGARRAQGAVMCCPLESSCPAVAADRAGQVARRRPAQGGVAQPSPTAALQEKRLPLAVRNRGVLR